MARSGLMRRAGSATLSEGRLAPWEDAVFSREGRAAGGVGPPRREVLRGRCLLTGAALIVISPVLWMISTSLRTPAESFNEPPQWIPDTSHLRQLQRRLPERSVR